MLANVKAAKKTENPRLQSKLHFKAGKENIKLLINKSLSYVN